MTSIKAIQKQVREMTTEYLEKEIPKQAGWQVNISEKQPDGSKEYVKYRYDEVTPRMTKWWNVTGEGKYCVGENKIRCIGYMEMVKELKRRECSATP